MKIETFETKYSMGKAAAEEAAKILIYAIKEKGEAIRKHLKSLKFYSKFLKTSKM